MSDPIRPYEPLIPMGRTIDSIVNWRDAASRDSQSLADEAMGDCNDDSDHAFGPVGGRSA